MFLILNSCTNTESTSYNFPVKESKKNILYKRLKIDTIIVKNPTTSYVGFFKYVNSQLYFFDKLFCTVLLINSKGEINATHLGKGQGPKEVPNIDTYTYANNKHIIFSGWNYFVFNNLWERQQQKVINWNFTTPMSELRNNPKPDYKGIYEVKYYENEFDKLTDSTVLFNIESTHPKYNGYFDAPSKKYYETAKILAELNFNTGKVIDIKGNYSKNYVENHNLPIFANFYKCISKNKIFLNFEADHKIYLYDKSLKPLYCFGIEPENINKNYIKTVNYEQTDGVWQEEHENKGFMSHIFYDENNNITYRLYNTGLKNDDSGETNPRRMQIYSGTTLVGDVQVPPQFKIIGQDNIYIYADGHYDENNNKIGFFKFKKILK